MLLHMARLLGITMTALGGQTENEPARATKAVLQSGSMNRRVCTDLFSADWSITMQITAM